jgi:hypothetical protein
VANTKVELWGSEDSCGFARGRDGGYHEAGIFRSLCCAWGELRRIVIKLNRDCMICQVDVRRLSRQPYCE